MIIEISIAVAAAAFATLVVFASIGIMSACKTFKELNKTLHAAKKDLDELSEESTKLIKHLNDITADVKKKLHFLNFFFKQSDLHEHMETESKKLKKNDTVSDIMECISAAMVIYNKVKGGLKAYVRSR